MRILALTKTIDPTIGGWGRYAQALLDALAERGTDSVVICHKLFSGSDVPQHTLVPPSLSFKKLYLFSWVYAVKIWLKRRKIGDIDVIHVMAEPYAPIAMLLSALLRVPYVVTIHGSRGVLPFGHYVYGFIQRCAYQRAVSIVCISNYTKNQLLRYVKLNNITVIANGVSEDMFSERGEEKQNTLLGVGGLKERKGYHHVLRALPLVRAAVPDIHYTIVGDQNDRQYTKELKRLVSELDLNDVVTFKTNISDEELDDLYRKAKVFVLTPVSTDFGFEGFGLVFLEANAHGVPVIGAYGSGAEEAIADGRSGFLVDVEKKDALAKKMTAFLTMEKSEYEQHQKQAQQWAREHLWSPQAKQYEHLYRMCTIGTSEYET